MLLFWLTGRLEVERPIPWAPTQLPWRWLKREFSRGSSGMSSVKLTKEKMMLLSQSKHLFLKYTMSRSLTFLRTRRTSSKLEYIIELRKMWFRLERKKMVRFQFMESLKSMSVIAQRCYPYLTREVSTGQLQLLLWTTLLRDLMLYSRFLLSSILSTSLMRVLSRPSSSLLILRVRKGPRKRELQGRH